MWEHCPLCSCRPQACLESHQHPFPPSHGSRLPLSSVRPLRPALRIQLHRPLPSPPRSPSHILLSLLPPLPQPSFIFFKCELVQFHVSSNLLLFLLPPLLPLSPHLLLKSNTSERSLFSLSQLLTSKSFLNSLKSPTITATFTVNCSWHTFTNSDSAVQF